MIKNYILGLVFMMGLVVTLLGLSVNAQTNTPMPSPTLSPTTTVPGGAPATGRGV